MLLGTFLCSGAANADGITRVTSRWITCYTSYVISVSMLSRPREKHSIHCFADKKNFKRINTTKRVKKCSGAVNEVAQCELMRRGHRTVPFSCCPSEPWRFRWILSSPPVQQQICCLSQHCDLDCARMRWCWSESHLQGNFRKATLIHLSFSLLYPSPLPNNTDLFFLKI